MNNYYLGLGLAALLALPVAANATLMSRLGGQAAYDDVLDITWLTDADLSGAGTWQNQLDWVSGLNTANHLGFSDWRLASMSVAAGLPTGTAASVVNCALVSATDCRDNELGYMYYHNMDGTGDNRGDQTVDGVLLTDVQSRYWPGTEFNSSNAWYIFFSSGGQSNFDKSNNSPYGWAVRAGDVAATVPEPGTLVLMGAALAGLLGFGRQKRRP